MYSLIVVAAAATVVVVVLVVVVAQRDSFIREEIEHPSKLIVGLGCCPKYIMFVSGCYYEGGRLNQTSSFMRREIAPPSKLLVNKENPPRGGGV